SQVKEGAEIEEGVRVGEVLLRLGAQKKDDGNGGGPNQRVGETTANVPKHSEKEPTSDTRFYVRKYKPTTEDVQWAHNGVVATVINGEAISVVQNRIADAGFADLTIIQMGADKVLVRSTSDTDVVNILYGAKEFFNMIFSNWVRWNKEVVPSQRGAWVRLYGIPLHAWNENFFKLCVFDCGRFLRVNSYTVEKDRLDYTRILIATSDLEVVKREDKLLV
ncbi:sulfate transporter, partial [Trifolium medium]|nr:sulfate transporter [Trifolium medium]